MKNINLNSFVYNPQISREDIFSVLKQEDIYSFYLGYSVEAGDKINSPFRDDNVPSFGFYYRRDKSGILMYNDLATPNSGDAIVFVSKLFQISYKESLFKICYDFNLSDVKVTSEQKYIIEKHIQKEATKISLGIKIRKWQRHDRIFWQSFGITKKTLIKYNVFPISYVFFNGNAVKSDLHAYAYVEFKDDTTTYKIYQPFSTNMKWICNVDSSVHQGYTNLPKKHKYFIITKSLKDVMSIKDVSNIPSVGLQSESIKIKKSVFEEYDRRFENIFCLFDNDKAGIKLADEFEKIYNIPKIFMPEIKKVTDFSDFVKEVGKEKAKKKLYELINKI